MGSKMTCQNNRVESGLFLLQEYTVRPVFDEVALSILQRAVLDSEPVQEPRGGSSVLYSESHSSQVSSHGLPTS